MYRDRGIGTRKTEMNMDKDWNRDRVTVSDVQGQRDMDKIETRTVRETRRQVQGQRDMERDTKRDRDRGRGRVTGKKDRGTGTVTEGQGQ